LRVLVLTDQVPARGGGAEVFLVGLATHLPRERFEVWVCATRVLKPGPLLDALEAAGVRCVSLDRRARWDVLRMRRLVTLLRRHRFDIVHAHKFGSNVWGVLIGTACRVPVLIAHEHSWSYEGQPLRRWIDGRVIGRLASRFVAVSGADAKRMISHEKVAREKVVILPTAYVPSTAGRLTDLRAELGLGNEIPLVGTAAVLRPEKAIEVMLEAHALLLERVPDAHLAIAGDGARRGALERRKGELGLDGHVHFLGSRDDVDAILQAVDVAALSSDSEGMPLFALECMANHTPLVATAVGGVPELVRDGTTGLLVPPRDPAALADALAALLLDPARRERLATAAAERMAEFTIEAVTTRFAQLYEALAEEAGIS
jgi:glycosyltransferase involved in cell wall biosynthesis